MTSSSSSAATRAQIVAEARTWIGTPWAHRMWTKGVGCDCVGLVRGTMHALGLLSADMHEWPGAHEYADYSQEPRANLLKTLCDRYLAPVSFSDMQLGDVCLFAVQRHPQHLAIVADSPHGGLSIIHASQHPRQHKVVEMRLIFGRTMRFVAAYALPGVVDG